MSGTRDEGGWGIRELRSSLRVLGAMPARAGDAAGTARALRLVRDMLDRRAVMTELFQAPSGTPLLVAGAGPVLLVSYLDDAVLPSTVEEPSAPPRIVDDIAAGPGITRKAGVLAACGALLQRPDAPITLVIEADRHAGSSALEAWLRQSERRFSAGLWEAVDLPIPTPTLFRSANGIVRVWLRAVAGARPTETLYAGVLPDAGHRLAEALATMKSTDAEVLLPGFYDDVDPPSVADVANVEAVSDAIGAWLAGATRRYDGAMSASHLALGVFCAPSLFVRDLHMSDAGPYIAGNASATIEARIVPAQTPLGVVRAIHEFIERRLPGTTIEPLFLREAAEGRLIDLAGLGNSLPVLPNAPGDSPAGLLEANGVPTAGYALVGHSASASEERVTLPALLTGSTLLHTMADTAAAATATSR